MAAATCRLCGEEFHRENRRLVCPHCRYLQREVQQELNGKAAPRSLTKRNERHLEALRETRVLYDGRIF